MRRQRRIIAGWCSNVGKCDVDARTDCTEGPTLTVTEGIAFFLLYTWGAWWLDFPALPLCVKKEREKTPTILAPCTLCFIFSWHSLHRATFSGFSCSYVNLYCYCTMTQMGWSTQVISSIKLTTVPWTVISWTFTSYRTHRTSQRFQNKHHSHK